MNKNHNASLTAVAAMAMSMASLPATPIGIGDGPHTTFGGYGGRGAINGGGRVKDTQSPVRITENRERRRAAKKARKKNRGR